MLSFVVLKTNRILEDGHRCVVLCMCCVIYVCTRVDMCVHVYVCVLQCVSVCCSVLLHTTVCYGVLQCVASIVPSPLSPPLLPTSLHLHALLLLPLFCGTKFAQHLDDCLLFE